MKTNSNTSSRIKRIFTDNIALKIISVILAFILWFYIVSINSPISEKQFTGIPIQIINNSDIYSVYDEYNGTIDITVTGKRTDISKITSDDFEAIIDVSNVTEPGKQSFNITLEVPNGIEVKKQSLNSVSLYVGIKTETSVPVTVDMNNAVYTLDKNLEIDKSGITTSVNSVNVSGPDDIIKNIDHASVSPGDMGNLSSSVKITSEITLVDKDGNAVESPYINYDNSTVTINIPVVTEKTLPLSVSYKYGFFNDDNTDITVYPENIKVKGEVSVLNEFDEINILTIDEKHTTTSEIQTSITMPEGIENISDYTSAIVNINYISTDTKEVRITDFSNINNPDNLKYDINTQSLTLLLRGDNDYISGITAKDITVSIDLTSAEPGNHDIPVSITFTDEYKNHVYELGDYSIRAFIHE